MKKQFELIKQTKNNFLKLVDNLSIDELNIIPSGFTNNIIWNLGHIIAINNCYVISFLTFSQKWKRYI